MEISKRGIDGVHEIKLAPSEDKRGFFMRVYDQDVFNKNGIDRNWVQDSHSLSNKKGVIRGLHFQYPPRAETKLVRVVTGKIYDVYLDLRASSPSFGEWGSVELSEENKKMIYIPRGFAHGFCTMSERVEIIYRIDNYYDPELASVVRWDSSTLGIPWPAEDPIISEKDKQADSFNQFVKKQGGIEV